MDRAEIQHKIEQLKAERDRFVQQANGQVTFLNGKIAGLEELIAPKPAPKEGQTDANTAPPAS